MLHVTNQIDTSTTYTYSYSGWTSTYQWCRSYQDNKFAFSPLFRVGMTLFPARLISFRSDVAYVGYGNAATAPHPVDSGGGTGSPGTQGAPAAGQTFDLRLSGLMVRELVQVRL